MDRITPTIIGNTASLPMSKDNAATEHRLIERIGQRRNGTHNRDNIETHPHDSANTEVIPNKVKLQNVECSQ